MRIWEGFQHGINFGGWLSQGEHSDKHYETFLTETDFAVAARWGLDHVRIPVDYELVETEAAFKKKRISMDRTVHYMVQKIWSAHDLGSAQDSRIHL